MEKRKTGRMAINLKIFAVYVFVLAGAIFFIQFYVDNTLGYTLAYVLLILAALSLWGALTARRRIRVTYTAPHTTVERGQPFTYTLHIQSRGLWTYYGLKVTLAEPRWTEKGDFAGAPIGRHGTLVTYTASYPYCGVYPYGAETVSAREFLGLLRVYVPGGRAPNNAAVVLPAYDPAFHLPLTRRREGQSQALRLHAGAGSDVRDLRQYTPEDSLRHVHWKASARRDELIVKDYADDTRPGILVLPSLGPGDTGDLRFLELRDRLAATAASVLYDCVRRHVPAELVCDGSIPVETSGEFGTAREALARLAQGSHDSAVGIKQAVETHPEATGAVLLVTELTMDLLDAVESAIRRGWQVYLYHFPRKENEVPEEIQRRLAELERGGAAIETICA